MFKILLNIRVHTNTRTYTVLYKIEHIEICNLKRNYKIKRLQINI